MAGCALGRHQRASEGARRPGPQRQGLRTWNATVLTAVALAGHPPNELSKTGRSRAVNGAVKDVAGYLSNTPSVCAYIDPRVIDRFDSGETIRRVLDHEVNGAEPSRFAERERIERAVLDLIR